MPVSAPAPLPRTIDEVVDHLDTILADALRRGSRHGYFAALYNRVTRAVRAGIHAGRFDDGARMERLDVVFANRYIDAYARHQRGEAPTLSWHAAFAAANRTDLSVLQHLLLGMNAHINLDLGIAAATIAPGPALQALQPDFNHINDVLASLLPTVEAQLRQISPSLDVLAGVAHDLNRIDERLGNFSIEKARDGAWRFARRLARLDTLARGLDIAARDTVTAAIGVKLQAPGPAGALLGGENAAAVTAHLDILNQRLATDV